MTIMVSMRAESLNYIPLRTDGIDMENEMPNKGTQHYKIKVGNDFQFGQDLVISAKAVGARSDPDLFISSSGDPFPSRQNNEYACAMVGDDVCTIPSKEISNGKTFYVTVRCFKKCEYAIKAELLEEIPIRPKRDYSIITNSAAQRIFVFNNTHGGVKDILISVRSDSTTSSMRMYVKEGTDGVPTSNDVKSADAWENGIILKFNSNSIVNIGEGQTYKILFETDEAINANLRIDMVYRDLIITEGKAYDDFLLSRDKSCYKYQIKSADKIFRVGVYSFSGNPDIYVTSETDNIDNLDRFEYKATEPTDDVLVITPEDRKKNGVVKGWYHICVLAKSTTSYRLRVAESNENYFLEDGIAETNEVKSGQDLTLYYTDAALVRNLNLTFTLSPHSGTAPQMYIKFCGRVDEEY